MDSIYHHKKVEKKWREKWRQEAAYQPDLDKAKKPFYNLMMFPYPSAEGLHVGNVYAFVGSDVYGRFQKLQGKDVFEPIGFDAFGIHSENYAIQIGEHPRKLLDRNIKHFREDQLMKIGNMFDWSAAVDTTHPDYYRWTQWIFLQLYKSGLAVRKKAPVNWCPSCKTVLADEQVENGVCERCKSPVEKRQLEQWFFTITKYAERLLNNLSWIDWTEKTKIAQRNWIGRSEGINIDYQVEGVEEKITVFTTRPDTNFGATFLVLAPDSFFVQKHTGDFPKAVEVRSYVEKSLKVSDVERVAAGREKTGVFTGWYALNRLNGKKLPIYVSDFVLASVGTGAVVGVPGHDVRDFEFAKTMGVEIIRVVVGPDGDTSPVTRIEQVQEEAGTMINSAFLDELPIKQAQERIKDYLEEKGWGKRVVNYRLRDWLISRQRYWGPPIPIVYCSKCGTVPVPEKELPVRLPDLEDFQPDGSGVSPLARVKDFVETRCPKCGESARRETDVTDNFLDSAWYFFRYPSKDVSDRPFDAERTKKWLPVDMYIGGHEHAVLHLMYTRFVTMALKDLGCIDFEEPFKKFRAHGLIIKDGAKMSKSKGNVINPDDYLEKFGADSLRTYLMFLGPFAEDGDFSERGIFGIVRFFHRLWNYVNQISGKFVEKEDELVIRRRHQLLKKVAEDIESLSYHTAIAKIMEYLRCLEEASRVNRSSLEALLFALAPFAPHLSEELWRQVGQTQSIFQSRWPKFDPRLIDEEKVWVIVQVNGKLRDRLYVDRGLSEEDIDRLAQEKDRVQKYLAGKKVKKRIFVANRLVNFVV